MLQAIPLCIYFNFMYKNELETDRLLFKPITNNDFDRLYQLYTQPEVMQYIYDGSTFNQQQAKLQVDGFVEHWQQHGIGMWMLYLKDDFDAIGYAGFRYFKNTFPEFKDAVELGYILDKPYWRKGFAKEVVPACVEAGMQHYKFPRILATILPENIGSQKAAQHAGMQHSFDVDIAGLSHMVFEIT